MTTTPSPIEARLKQMGHELPRAPEVVGSYVPVVRTGNLVITSGQLPTVGKMMAFRGKLGKDVHEADGINASRICAINALSQLKAFLGSLEKITRIVRVEGYVQSAPGFTNQPQVLNGASQLLTQAFGEIGMHTRVAIGVSELPLNAAVEVALWVEVSAD